MDTGTARIDASLPRRRWEAAPTSPPDEPWRRPLLTWALVLAVAMLSFYVHLLNDHVNRSEAQRSAQRSPPANGDRLATQAQRVSAQALRVAQTAAPR